MPDVESPEPMRPIPGGNTTARTEVDLSPDRLTGTDQFVAPAVINEGDLASSQAAIDGSDGQSELAAGASTSTTDTPLPIVLPRGNIVVRGLEHLPGTRRKQGVLGGVAVAGALTALSVTGNLPSLPNIISEGTPGVIISAAPSFGPEAAGPAAGEQGDVAGSNTTPAQSAGENAGSNSAEATAAPANLPQPRRVPKEVAATPPETVANLRVTAEQQKEFDQVALKLYSRVTECSARGVLNPITHEIDGGVGSRHCLIPPGSEKIQTVEANGKKYVIAPSYGIFGGGDSNGDGQRTNRDIANNYKGTLTFAAFNPDGGDTMIFANGGNIDEVIQYVKENYMSLEDMQQMLANPDSVVVMSSYPYQSGVGIMDQQRVDLAGKPLVIEKDAAFTDGTNKTVLWVAYNHPNGEKINIGSSGGGAEGGSNAFATIIGPDGQPIHKQVGVIVGGTQIGDLYLAAIAPVDTENLQVYEVVNDMSQIPGQPGYPGVEVPPPTSIDDTPGTVLPPVNVTAPQPPANTPPPDGDKPGTKPPADHSPDSHSPNGDKQSLIQPQLDPALMNRQQRREADKGLSKKEREAKQIQAEADKLLAAARGDGTRQHEVNAGELTPAERREEQRKNRQPEIDKMKLEQEQAAAEQAASSAPADSTGTVTTGNPTA